MMVIPLTPLRSTLRSFLAAGLDGSDSVLTSHPRLRDLGGLSKDLSKTIMDIPSVTLDLLYEVSRSLKIFSCIALTSSAVLQVLYWSINSLNSELAVQSIPSRNATHLFTSRNECPQPNALSKRSA